MSQRKYLESTQTQISGGGEGWLRKMRAVQTDVWNLESCNFAAWKSLGPVCKISALRLENLDLMLWTTPPTRKQRNFSKLICTGAKTDLLNKCFGYVWEYVRFSEIFHLYLNPNHFTGVLVRNGQYCTEGLWQETRRMQIQTVISLWLPWGRFTSGTVSPRVSRHRGSTMTRLPTQRRNKMDRVAGVVKGQKREIQFCTGTPILRKKPPLFKST